MTQHASEDRPVVTISTTPDPNMADIPIACRRCGASALIGLRLPEGGQMWGMSFRCHVCGFQNEQQETHKVIRTPDGLRAVFLAFKRTDLTNLQNAIQVAASAPAAATVEDVAAVVESTSPEIATWLRSAENRKELAVWLGLLVAAIGMLISLAAYRQSLKPTPADVNQIVVQIQSGQITGDGLPRRAPCWCGSDKRYKNCHGRETPQLLQETKLTTISSEAPESTPVLDHGAIPMPPKSHSHTPATTSEPTSDPSESSSQ